MLKGEDMVETDNIDDEDRQDQVMPPIKPIDIQIKVAGLVLSNEIMQDLVNLTVEQHARLPSRFEIHFIDKELVHLDDAQFDVGKEVEISCEDELLIKGEITALQPVLGEVGNAEFVVLGHTKDNRLIRGTKTQVFTDMTDSQIAQHIAGNCNLTADVGATSVKHDQVFQHNLTDMEFLAHLARRNGFTCYAEDGTLHFKKPSKPGQGPSLAWGQELHSFQARVDAAHQVDKVIVKGWDPNGKEAISSEVISVETPLLKQTGFPNSGGDLAKGAFGSAELAVVDQPVSSPDEAQAMAKARFNEMDGASVRAEGSAAFNPKIKAGSWVEVEGVGTKYSGSYWVGTATHVYERGSGETRFSTDGRPAEIFEEPDQPKKGPDRWPGVVPALVTNLEDPDDLGRVKVKFPWLADDLESTWARVVGIGAGPERGMLVLPEINDEVLVVFEHGDFNRPYVLGGVWSSTDKPPMPSSEAVSDGTVNLRTWRSRSGHRITLDDTEGEEKLELMSKNEHRITMDDTAGEEKLEIQTQGGHLITMNDTAGEEKLEIQTQGGHTVTLDDVQNKVIIETQGDMLVEAEGNLDLKAQGNLNLEGAAMNIKAMTNLSMAGQALVEIKGGLIKLN
jgi:Rhs element Vgr protein